MGMNEYEAGCEQPSKPGIVYLFVNEAMPGYVKIGLTQSNDVKARLKQLDKTSVPLPFVCQFAAKVPDCRKLEKTLHFVFGEKQARRGREFFKIDPLLAKAIILLVAIEEVTPSKEEQGISQDEENEIQQTIKKRSELFTFDRVGLREGDILTFSKDPTVTCRVKDSRQVIYEGQQLYLSKAALMAIQKMGYNWPSVRGADYWMYNGRKLSDLLEDEGVGAESEEF